MKLTYYSHAGKPTGYGRAATDYQKGLLRFGVAVDARPLARVPDDEGGCAADVVVYHGTPHQLATVLPMILPRIEDGGQQKHVAVTTWETSRLSAELARALSQYHQIITPSRFCEAIISESISALSFRRAKTAVVPHGFDTRDWPATHRSTGDVFTFYTIADWGERKNPLGVLRAYLHAFTREDAVRLVMVLAEPDFDTIRSLIVRSNLGDDLPELVIPNKALTDSEIVALHQDADCFVSATRGEGWGLGMFEAALMQRTVIAPGYGGQFDFLAEQPCWHRIGHQMTPVFAGEGEVSVRGVGGVAKLRLPRGADARQLWADPNLDQLSRRMRIVFEEDNRSYERYERVRGHFESKYNIAAVGKQFLTALEEA